MTIDSSILSLFGSASGTTASMLDTIHGTGGSGGSNGDPIPALKEAERNQTKDVAAEAAKPDVARDIAAFKSAVAKAKTPAELLDNPQARDVLLTANGLGDQSGYTALAKKALLSDTNDPKSLANTLADTRWKTVTKTYDFANKGLSTLKQQSAIDSIANGYAQVKLQTGLDKTTPGLSVALDFRSRANTITSVDQILGDKNLRKAVTTALGIPDQIAFQPLEAQEHAISSRVDISKFKDPAFVEQFTQRYLIQAGQAAANNDGSGNSASGTKSGIVSLYA